MKLRQKEGLKGKISSVARGWLPILQASLEELPQALEPFKDENPFLQISTPREKNFNSFNNYNKSSGKKSLASDIENLKYFEKSLYEFLNDQINPPLFPTEKSQKIAYEIIEFINEEGYFEGNIDEIGKKLGVKNEDIEKIRERFKYLEPSGVGARNLEESFLFQLDEFELENNIYELARNIILNIDNLTLLTKEPFFNQAMSIVKKFKNPPAIEFLQERGCIIPDIFILEEKGEVEIRLNESFYPQILIDTDGHDEKNDFIKEKIKNAKDLVDALELRKATMHKIGLIILERQYDFFMGKEIKPMKLKDIADEIGRNPSTISRAISNKYLSCNRGIMALKSFFTSAVQDEETSNSSIKDFVLELIKKENRQKPLSDNDILYEIEKKYNIKPARRTITKYRLQLNIASSNDRKKLYLLNN